MAARKRWRGTTTERFGRNHEPRRRQAMAAHKDGDPCWRCGQPTYKWQALDLDHVVARALGGVDGPVVLAHASCNRSAGARMGNQMRGMMSSRLSAGWFTSRRW